MRAILASLLVAGMLTGCAHVPTDYALGTRVPLRPAPQLAGAAVPGARVWLAPDLAKYVPSSFYIPPVQVDHGPQAQFPLVDPAQVAALLTQDTRAAIGSRYRVVNRPGPGTHTIQLTLLRAIPPEAVRTNNGPYPWAAAVVGMPNLAYSEGEMLVAGKFVLASTGKLLAAFVAPVSPSNMMMQGPPGPADTQRFLRDASRAFARSLVDSVERQMAINRQAPPPRGH